MSTTDDRAEKFYADPANRKLGTPLRRRATTGRKLNTHVPIRFDADTVEAVQTFADEDGMTVSSWIRGMVEREVKMRAQRRAKTAVSGLVFRLDRTDGSVSNETHAANVVTSFG